MGDPIANMGFSLSATPAQYTPGQAMTLTLSNVDSGVTVRGVLLYVEDPDALDDMAMPIKRGNFTAPYPMGIKAVFDGYEGCNFRRTDARADARQQPNEEPADDPDLAATGHRYR